MYGKAFASMYTGSMVGSGAVVFAVWGYVIANMEPDKTVGMQVELNPRYLAGVFGEPAEAIALAIEKLCSPDPESRSKEQEGRRIIRIGQFAYQVVNGVYYREIRDKEKRREYQRKWAAEKSQKTKKVHFKSSGSRREQVEVKRHADGLPSELDERPPQNGHAYNGNYILAAPSALTGGKEVRHD